MKIEDKRNHEIVGEGFNRWLKAEISSYVQRCDAPDNAGTAARIITRNVTQFALGRLMTELASVGVTTGQVIEFLKKHAVS